jgi:hypothetical protein
MQAGKRYSNTRAVTPNTTSPCKAVLQATENISISQKCPIQKVVHRTKTQVLLNTQSQLHMQAPPTHSTNSSYLVRVHYVCSQPGQATGLDKEHLSSTAPCMCDKTILKAPRVFVHTMHAYLDHPLVHGANRRHNQSFSAGDYER